MKKAFVIAIKEIRTFLEDKGDLAFSLLLPIAVFALMYGAFSGQGLFHGTAYIVNEDTGGKYANILVDRLSEREELSVVQLTAADAENKLSRSDVLLVLYIPENFSRDLTAGSQAQLTFKQRGNGGQEGQIVAGIIKGVVQNITLDLQVQSQVQQQLAGQPIPADQIQILVEKYLDKENRNPTVIVTEQTVGTQPDPVNQFLPGIVTMFVLFSITLNARSIVEERKKGTLERLLTTQVKTGEIFTGKFIGGIFRGFIQTLVLFILAYLVFRIFTPLNFFETLLIALFFAAAASALGLCIAVIVRSEDAATWIGVFLTMLMTMLGGTFFSITPGTIWDTLSKFSINTYANQAINTVLLEGGSLADTGYQLAIMAAVAVLGVIVSRLLFRAVPGGKR